MSTELFAQISSVNLRKPAKDGSDPCDKSARVTVVVAADGTVTKCIDPFDAREGPAALLADL